MSASPQLSKTPSPAVERRRSPRRSIVDEQIVAVTLDDDNGGLVLDLAENGMAVQAVTPLHAGKTTEMGFVIGERRVPIRAHGVVRWAESSGRAGIRLLAFSEGSSADIRAALLQPPSMVAAKEGPPAPVELAPAFDRETLEKEIAGLDREASLARLAERTRELASASGIAIALGTPQQMVCRASAGAAPSIGARLQSDSGLSGECVRTQLLVRCDDTESDARVDAGVCRQLDLRSAVLVPILDAGAMRGVLEVFSNRPHAFASDDIRRFEQLAELIARIMREPAGVLPPRTEPVVPAPVAPSPAPVTRTAPVMPAPFPPLPAPLTRTAPVMPAPVLPPPVVSRVKPPEPLTEVFEEPPTSTRSEVLRSPAAKGSAVLFGVLVLTVVGWSVLRHRQPAPAAAQVAAAPAAAVVPAVDTPAQAAPVQPALVASTKAEPAKPGKETKESRVAKTEKSAPAEELAVRELPTAGSQPDPVAPSAVALVNGSLPAFAVPAANPARPREVSAVVPVKLVRRVAPVYPDIARRAHIGGTVVLNAVIRPDGKVGTVQVVSGNPLLARAAVDAVQQWRYEPARLNGTSVPSEAKIRLTFDPNLQLGH